MKRTHRLYEPLQRVFDAKLLRDVASSKALAVARYEPAIRQGAPSGLLDLTFFDGGLVAVAPLIVLDHAMLIEPEDDALIWPKAVADALDDDVLDAIADKIVPWLFATSVTDGLNREHLRVFDEPFAGEAFGAAREAGFLGAAPYSQALVDSAPALYAERFAKDARVGIQWAGAANAATLLARHARNVVVDLGSETLNTLATRWFAFDCYRAIRTDEAFDVLVAAPENLRDATVQIACGAAPDGFSPVNIAKIVPLTVLLSFDENDARSVGRFGIRVARAAEPRFPRFGRRPAPVGGSHGRILIAGRRNQLEEPDADGDDIAELAERLRAEGFAVTVTAGTDAVDVAGFDLVHAFGLHAAEETAELLERAHAASVPSVLTTGLEDVAAQAVWGIATLRSIVSTGIEEREVAPYLNALAGHVLSVPGIDSRGRNEPRPGYEQAVMKALRLAGVALVSGSAEEKLVRSRFGRTGPVSTAGPYINTEVAYEPIEHLVGTGDFALAHAPVTARSNQLLLVRAARDAAIPLVLLGAIADPQYAELVRESAGTQCIFVPSATPGQAAALYGRARVYIDSAWIGLGLHRLARAAASGCALAVANLRYAPDLWRPGLWEFDPASVASITTALREAWTGASEHREAVAACADRVAIYADPLMALVSTVTAYATAQGNLNCRISAAEI